MQYKSTKDVENDVEEVVKNITNEKTKTLKEYENLAKTIDSRLHDADDDIDNSVIELNTSIGLTEKTLDQKKEFFSEKLNNSVGIYKESVDEIKKKIDDELKWYTLILAFLLIFYDITISWLFQSISRLRPTGWPILFDGLSIDLLFTTVKIGLVIYVIYRLWQSYNQIKNSINKKYLELGNENEQFTAIDSSLPEITTSKRIFDEIKPSIQSSNSVLEALLVIVGKSTPIISESYQHLTLITKYEKIVINFKHALKFFNIPFDEDFFQDMMGRIPFSYQIIDDEDFWKGEIAEKIVTVLNAKKNLVDPKTIMLLYEESNGIESNRTFREIIESDENRHHLAEVLIASKRLIQVSTINLQIKDIDAILKIMDSFNLQKINNILSKFENQTYDFKIVLDYYGLHIRPDFFKEIKRFVPAKDQISDDENIWHETIINKLISEIKKNNIHVSPKILALLFNDNYGIDTTNIYREIRESEQERMLLAEILINSKKLVSSPSTLSYQASDIDAVLKSIDSFDLSKINGVISKSIRSLDYLKSYFEFLEKNEIGSKISPSIQFLIENDERSSITYDQQIINFCYKLGTIVFANEASLPSNFKDGFVRASITMKFHNEISLKQAACSISATDEATTVIKAYLEKSRGSDRRQIVLLRELIADIQLVESVFQDKCSFDFDFLKTQFREGNWYDSSSAYLKDFFDQNTKKIIEQIGEVGNFVILKQIVRETFKKVHISTVEKAIDAQIFGAYIIMFQSKRGPLKDCLDKLSIRDLDNLNPEKQWDIRDEKDILSIKEKFGIVPNYDFVKFSDSTRIGVFKKNISFSQLQEVFFADLKAIINQSTSPPNPTEEKPFDIGVVMVRISPTKYNLGILDNDQISDVVDIKKLDVGNYIARLAIDSVDPEELASISQSEKDMNVLEILDHYSLFEMIRIENEDSNSIERKLLERNELKQEIIEGIKNQTGIPGLRSLAIDLGRNRIEKEVVSPVIQKIFFAHLSVTDGMIKKAQIRSDILSKRLVDVLKNLALIYEIKD
jgi:hypothetical protein